MIAKSHRQFFKLPACRLLLAQVECHWRDPRPVPRPPRRPPGHAADIIDGPTKYCQRVAERICDKLTSPAHVALAAVTEVAAGRMGDEGAGSRVRVAFSAVTTLADAERLAVAKAAAVVA